MYIDVLVKEYKNKLCETGHPVLPQRICLRRSIFKYSCSYSIIVLDIRNKQTLLPKLLN